MSSLTLFEWQEPHWSVRGADPATSRKAMRELPVSVRQGEVLSALRWLTVSATADEVKACLAEHAMLRERNEVASRLSELGRMVPPLARKVGTRTNHRGKTVATWALTAEGREAAS